MYTIVLFTGNKLFFCDTYMENILIVLVDKPFHIRYVWT